MMRVVCGLSLLAMLLVGCGSGGSDTPTAEGDSFSKQFDQNKGNATPAPAKTGAPKVDGAPKTGG